MPDEKKDEEEEEEYLGRTDARESVGLYRGNLLNYWYW